MMTNEQADRINDLRDRLAGWHAHYRALDLDSSPEEYAEVRAAIRHTENELAIAEGRMKQPPAEDSGQGERSAGESSAGHGPNERSPDVPHHCKETRKP